MDLDTTSSVDSSWVPVCQDLGRLQCLKHSVVGAGCSLSLHPSKAGSLCQLPADEGLLLCPCCRDQLLETASTETPPSSCPRGAGPAAAPATRHRDGASAGTAQRALTAFLSLPPPSEELFFPQQLGELKALSAAKCISWRTVVQPVAFSVVMHFNDSFPPKKLFLLDFSLPDTFLLLCLKLQWWERAPGAVGKAELSELCRDNAHG